MDYTLVAACLGATALTIILVLGLPKRRKYPPGPSRWPVIGNLLDVPTHHPWIRYHEWAVEHKSDIIHLDVFGTHMIILDSLEAARDLLDKRSAIYSSRPRSPMLNELSGFEWAFALRPYGDAWRSRRRVFQSGFNPKAARQYLPQHSKACHGLLRLLLDSPENWAEHLRYEAGALIMNVTYGIDVLAKNDPHIATAKIGMMSVAVASAPGAFLVDALPILRYIPSWVPGAGFQKKATDWKKSIDHMRDAPFKFVKDAMESTNAKSSFVSNAIHGIDPNSDIAERELIIRDAAGTAYAGASDTSVAAMSAFILAMVKYPEVQAKAQAELDRVLGQYQLPTFNDEESLPYITALMMEFLRWHPCTPLTVPHMSIQDDEYKGYLIPAGSIMIPNAWAMLHDEKVYPDPFELKPERFLKDGKIDSSVPGPWAFFGFGRRICPGDAFIRSGMWLEVGSILATFNIQKAVDANGNPIEVSGEVDSGILCHPLPFQCQIIPRSKEAEQIIRMTAYQAA